MSSSSSEEESNAYFIQKIAAEDSAIADLEKELIARKRKREELKLRHNRFMLVASVKQVPNRSSQAAVQLPKAPVPIVGQMPVKQEEEEEEDEEEDYSMYVDEDSGEDAPAIQRSQEKKPLGMLQIQEDEEEIIDIEEEEEEEEEAVVDVKDESNQEPLTPVTPSASQKKARKKKRFSLSLSSKRASSSSSSSSAPSDPFFPENSIYKTVKLRTAEWKEWDDRVVGNWTIGAIKSGANIIVEADRYDERFDLQIPGMIQERRSPGNQYGYWMVLLTANPEIVQLKEGTFPGDPRKDPGAAPDKILFTGRYYYSDTHDLTGPLQLDKGEFHLVYAANQVVWNFSELPRKTIIPKIEGDTIKDIKQEIEKMKRQEIERKLTEQKKKKQKREH